MTKIIIQAEPKTYLPLAGKKILLAEDDALHELIATTMLRNAGCEPVLAKNGKAAVELSEKNNFDIILMDVEMPEMNGITASREIRKKFPESNIPILALTSSLYLKKRNLIPSPFNDILLKPYDQEVLVSRILSLTKPSIVNRKNNTW